VTVPLLAPAPPPDVVAARVAGLRQRIEAAGRDPAGVRIVAVTKGFDAAAVQGALAAGVTDIGENRADELLAKAGRFTIAGPDAPRWHYLGAIQRRRVRDLAPVVAMWQTLSRVEEGRAVADAAPGASVLVQVETTGSAGRNGCSPGEVPALVGALRAMDLAVAGLMLLAPRGPDAEVRAAMRQVASVAGALGLSEVSMGMTGDLDTALAEGTTMVRVGEGLFGPRPVPLRRD
jgi:uncharacterized pyridoxal phosphate-containing UPF0001 family protein